MAALAAIVRVGLHIRAGPVALCLRVPAGASDDANGDLSAKLAPGAGIAARAAVVVAVGEVRAIARTQNFAREAAARTIARAAAVAGPRAGG